MKRIIPVAVAGMFFATVAFAGTGHEAPLVNQNTQVVTDTIPKQPQPDTLPPTTEPTQEDTTSHQVIPEPSKTDTSTTNPTMNPEKDTTNGWFK